MGHLLGGFVKLDLVITAPHYTPHESFETSFVTATKSKIQMAYENFMEYLEYYLLVVGVCIESSNVYLSMILFNN